MQEVLDPVETRVLASMVEKEVTTPEYYPLTLNALVNACNQKSNRDPVVSYEADDVEDALNRLRDRGLVSVLTGGGNRVAKFGHRLNEKFNLGRREIALLCELMLRGPQTVGELRDRAGRMHRFSGGEEVESVLRTLSEREPPYTVKLPKQAGLKEPRYAHLLSGEVSIQLPSALPMASADVDSHPLEAELSDLRERVRQLEEQFARFRSQFE